MAEGDVKKEVPIQVGMLGISIDEIVQGKSGYVLLPLGPLDPTIWGGRKLIRVKRTAMEPVRAWRDIIVGNEQLMVKEHTPVEISYEKTEGGYQRMGETNPMPIRVIQFNMAEVVSGKSYVANDDILSEDIEPTMTPTTLRVTCCFSADTLLTAVYDNGTTEYDLKLNEGVDLLADCLYSFDVVVTDTYTINFEGDAAATISLFIVTELPGQ